MIKYFDAHLRHTGLWDYTAILIIHMQVIFKA